MSRSLAFVAVLLSTAGCFHPDVADGDFVCGAGGLCPSGFSCGGDHFCRRMAVGASDMSGGAFAGDGTLGAFDLTGMSGLVECNTENGEIKLTPSGGTAMIVVAAGQAGFQHLSQTRAGAPAVGLWNFTSVLIPKSITVRPQSASKSIFALASTTTMSIAGTLDWRSFGGFGGLAATAGDDRMQMVSGGGLAGTGASGGGGGGHRDDGKPGAPAPNGGGGGMTYGTPA
ncbi:MAG: hypothetical protein JWN44_3597, partial [Myxococcales bacterium]|nr:hypothetical protein [Myxococcales bacterium]